MIIRDATYSAWNVQKPSMTSEEFAAIALDEMAKQFKKLAEMPQEPVLWHYPDWLMAELAEYAYTFLWPEPIKVATEDGEVFWVEGD
jgi:hypothetical protein